MLYKSDVTILPKEPVWCFYEVAVLSTDHCVCELDEAGDEAKGNSNNAGIDQDFEDTSTEERTFAEIIEKTPRS